MGWVNLQVGLGRNFPLFGGLGRVGSWVSVDRSLLTKLNPLNLIGDLLTEPLRV